MNLILYLPIILSFEFNLKVGTLLKVIEILKPGFRFSSL